MSIDGDWKELEDFENKTITMESTDKKLEFYLPIEPFRIGLNEL